MIPLVCERFGPRRKYRECDWKARFYGSTGRLLGDARRNLANHRRLCEVLAGEAGSVNSQRLLCG